MNETVINQLFNLFIFATSGIIIGIFFDFFRILRKTIKTSDLFTNFQDFLFWLITGFFLLFLIFRFNNGELRNYIFIGLVLGLVFYFLFLSSKFVEINLKFLVKIRQIFSKISFFCKKL